MNKRERKSSSPTMEIWLRLKKNRLAVISLVILGILVVISILGERILPYNYAEQDYSSILERPNAEHLLGTDNFGRDIFSRILFGTRFTLIIGFGCATVAAILGTVLGILAATNRRLDMIIMRCIDVIMGIPTFMLSLSIIVALGSSIRNMMIALSITCIPLFTRIVRSQVLTIQGQEYIEAATAIGASRFWIIRHHIIPNSMAVIIVQYTLEVVDLITWSASLSFIGMGVQPPTPEWGLMISAGRTYLQDYWYMSIMPGIALIICTYALNLLGDGLRDALDPRLKR